MKKKPVQNLCSDPKLDIIYIIVVFNSDNYVPVLDNLAPIENITSFGQFCPNYGQLNIFTFNGTLFDYTYPLYYPYHKVDNYVLFSIHHQGGRHHHQGGRHNHHCLIFLQCAFSNVSSTRLPEIMHNHTGCICLTFLHCVFQCVLK